MLKDPEITASARQENLVDAHGRTVRYLRISVTDRCNFFCRYCRDENLNFLPHDDILRYEEIEQVIDIAASFGVRKLRFTGGEPFVRPGFMDFLERVHKRFPSMALRLTTNGTLLQGSLERLKDLGIAVNLSLDSLDRERFAAVTGCDLLPVVKSNLYRILELGIPLKINVVGMRGINDDEMARLAGLAMDWPLDVRFIEFMPMGSQTIWSEQTFWPASEMLDAVRAHWTLTPVAQQDRFALAEAGPAQLWTLTDATGRRSQGHFGLITSVSHSFCPSCNRLRLTAEGNLRTCLFDDREYALRDPLRTQGPDIVRSIMRAAVADKPVGSQLLARRQGAVARKRMSAIGG